MCLFSAPVLAQGQVANPASSANLTSPQSTGERTNQSSGLEGGLNGPAKPAPHIYHKGDHLSPSYGEYQVVTDWPEHKLTRPPSHMHWVKYGNNYFLVEIANGEIKEIVRATG
jgi:Ni/Co efflux regulator RcnB